MKKRPGQRTTASKVLQAARAGDWPPPAEFIDLAKSAAASEGNHVVSLQEIDHLDAGSLQILLALQAELRKRGAELSLTHVSPALSQWFAYAGADQQFSRS